MQSCNYPPTLSPHFLSNHVFWIERVAGAGRLQQGKKETEEGGNRKGRNMGSERQGRRGVCTTAVRAAKQDKSSGGTPPPVRWTLLPHSSSSCLHHRFFLLLPSLLLLYYSSVCWESLARGSSCCCSSQITELAGSPPCLAWLLRWIFPTPNRPTIHPSIPRHGDSELALFCCWEGEWAIIELLS